MTQFATAKIGAIMVCINPAYRLYELEHALNSIECKSIVTAESFKSSQYLDMLNELSPELKNCKPGALVFKKLPHLKTVVRMGDGVSPGMFNFGDVCAMGRERQPCKLAELTDAVNADEIVNTQFTSGTTGSPKGAALTHRGILNSAYFNAKSMSLTQRDKLCIPVPLYHCFGMGMGVLCSVSVGVSMGGDINSIEVYRLYIMLREISPAISRRVLVRSETTIKDLHYGDRPRFI